MKKSSYCSLLFLFLLIIPFQTNAEISKIYFTDDAIAQLYDDDAISDWVEARNYQGEIFREPITSGELDNTGNIYVRSDKGVGTYRIYRSSNVIDLNELPSNVRIESAVLNLYRTDANNRGDIDVVVTSHTRDDINQMQKGDWKIQNFGEQEFSRGALNGEGYNSLSFSEAGVDFLNDNLGKKITLGILTEFDFDNVEPTGSILSAGWHEIEMPGVEFDPYLEITFVEKDKYPLYTQGTSTHPSLEETLSWTHEPYADGNVSGCKYISSCGCAITSLVMGARYFGKTEDVLNSDVNPLNINEYLDSVGGYPGGILSWFAAQAYLGEIDEEGRLTSRFDFVGHITPAEIEDYLDDEHIVLGYRDWRSKEDPNHFVWVTELLDGGYLIRDPNWYETETTNDDAAENVRDYDDFFDSGRVYRVYDEPQVVGSGVEAFLTGTAELLYTSAAGDSVGYEEGSVVVDLERSFYGTPDTVSLAQAPSADDRYLLVPNSGDTFTLDAVGTGVGEFSMDIFAISEGGEILTFALSGQTIPGVTTSFEINLETGEVTESEIDLDAFLSIIDALSDGMTQQQKAFFERWAKKMFKTFEEKTVSQALQALDVFEKLLIAKKVEVPTFFSVLDKLRGQVE